VAYVTDKIDEKVVELLRDGGAGLLPTDTIYGFTCRAEDREAVERLHKLKERNTNKPFIILISDIKMLNMLSISDSGRELVNKYWPGALSVIFPAPAAPAWLTRGTDPLAVRLPADGDLRRLISKAGPIISTSANLQGRPPVHSVKEAKKLFGDKLDFYVDYGSLDNPPSTLVAIIDNKLQVIRQGAVKID
jgi:L-threonylcarbamoyladenylate synthase